MSVGSSMVAFKDGSKVLLEGGTLVDMSHLSISTSTHEYDFRHRQVDEAPTKLSCFIIAKPFQASNVANK